MRAVSNKTRIETQNEVSSPIRIILGMRAVSNKTRIETRFALMVLESEPGMRAVSNKTRIETL